MHIPIINVTDFDLKTNILYQNNQLALPIEISTQRIWWECIKERTNHIMRFMIHPVGFYCPGQCSYCMNKDKNRNNTNILTKEKLLSSLQYVFENYYDRINKEMFVLSFSGGSPFFHPHIEELIDCAYFIKDTYNIDITLSYFLDCLGNDNKLDDIARIISKYSKDFYSKVLYSCDFGTTERNFMGFNFLDRFHYLDSRIDKNIQRTLLTHYMKNFNITSFINYSLHYMNNNNYIQKIYPLGTSDLLFDVDTMYKDFDYMKKEIPMIPNVREMGYFISEDDTFMDFAYFTKIVDNVWYKIRFNEMNCCVSNTIGINQENYFLCFYGNLPVTTIDECINIPMKLYEDEKKLFLNMYCDSCYSKNVCPMCYMQRLTIPCEKYKARQEYTNMVTKDRYTSYKHFYDIDS